MRKNSNKIFDLLPADPGHISCFTISEMKRATENFSNHHLIGHGRFGSVYKGTLPSGQDIALRRLSVPAWQGTEEFITEVQLLSKLEHRNIVRLLGFCCEGEGNMLIHEFVPNKSLEGFLFDPKKQPMLDWSRRQKIIEGIARGLLYLHDESEVRIIHRDLKASNVLLDANMNPKIADSGLARIWQIYQSEVETSRIVGAVLVVSGYTSPEYFSHCQYSVKSDVYSFGILVLEIICGKKKLINHSDGTTESLIRYAWKEQMVGTPVAMLDPAVGDPDSYDGNEVIRYIQVALLCVQDDAEKRPTMASVPHMLLNSSVTLPAPQQPA